MSNAQADRLAAIKKELDDILEARIGDLLGAMKATQEVTRRLIATEEDIRRQTYLKGRLDAELGPLKTRSDGLTSETRELQARVDRLRENLERQKAVRAELISKLDIAKSGLADE